MIVDVVMQHLLSKDVLYQPMKVGAFGGTGHGSYCVAGVAELRDAGEGMPSAGQSWNRRGRCAGRARAKI
jgi:hypothetical protein